MLARSDHAFCQAEACWSPPQPEGWAVRTGEANIGIMRDEDGSFLAFAKRPIKKGEQVCPCPHMPSGTGPTQGIHSSLIDTGRVPDVA